MKLHQLSALMTACTVMGLGCAAYAADVPGQSEADKQQAACLSGQSNQDKATCLKEASAARAEARRGKLDDGTANHQKNSVERCKALPASEQSDCLARMKGSGTVSGSVAAGGLLREQKTTTTTNPGGVTIAPQAVPPLAPPVTASGPK